MVSTWTLISVFSPWVPLGCGPRPDADEQRLRRALDQRPRPVEGRLSVATRFAPFEQASSAGDEDSIIGDDERNIEGRVVRGAVASDGATREPRRLYQRGLLQVVRRHLGPAVALLSAAAAHDEGLPSVSGVHSDLAAAFLAYAADGRPWHHADAITAALTATTADPTAPAPAFNLALVLEQSFLWHEAEQAWLRYLTLDDDDGWRAEAQGRLDHLVARRSASPPVAASPAVAALPAVDRGAWFLGEGLAGWLDDPSHDLDPLRSVAQELALGTGDAFYEAVVRGLDQPMDDRLRSAMRAFVEGYAGRRGRCAEAVPQLVRAADRLRDTIPPLAFVARLEAVVCDYRRDPAAAARALAALAAQLADQPYLGLRARIAYMRGLCEIAEGRPSQAIGHYQRAAALQGSTIGAEATMVAGLLDEAHRLIGDFDTAWRYRLQSLGDATHRGDHRLRHVILSNAANQLADQGSLAAAGLVLNEMLANARSWDEAGAVVETLLRRIALDSRRSGEHVRNADAAAAIAADVVACRAALATVEEASHRTRFARELALVEGESLIGAQPERARTLLEAVVLGFETDGHRLLVPRAWLALARARLAVGDEAAAERAFERALKIFEERYGATEGEEHRIRFFEQTQPVFDAMIHLYAVVRGDAERALYTLARAQARGLGVDVPEAGVALPATGRADPVHVVYGVLAEHVVMWTAQGSRWRMHVEGVGRDEVVDTISRLRRALAQGGDVETAAAAAYDLLVRPVADRLPAGATVAIVPDRELYRLPFAALYDRLRGRYLVEDHALRIVPSVAFRAGAAAATVERPSVLVVGDPAFDPQHWDLPRLAAAQREAERVAALYADRRLLVGEAATREAMLDAVAGHAIVHLATHVKVHARRPLRSSIITAGPGPPLRVADLDAAHLSGVALVFLSGCETAPGYLDGNREGVAGFARALLAAGVPNVVATLWAADDEATARLAVAFHKALRIDGDVTRALQKAQLSLLADPEPSAPYAWANLQHYGG